MLIKPPPTYTHTHSFFSAFINCLSGSGVINELKLCDSFAFGDSPQKETMWLLSSWTNFLVTASSIICFTCQSQRQMLYDSFINVPQLFMNNSHTHTESTRGGLLVTVWLSAKKNILENNSYKRGKWWEGSALRVWKVKRRKKKSRVHAELEDESPALIPRTSTGKNGNVTCEFVWGWGGI